MSELFLGAGLAHELEISLRRADWENEDVVRMMRSVDLCKKIRRVLRGMSEIKECDGSESKTVVGVPCLCVEVRSLGKRLANLKVIADRIVVDDAARGLFDPTTDIENDFIRKALVGVVDADAAARLRAFAGRWLSLGTVRDLDTPSLDRELRSAGYK